ncbi:hypothetical protein SAMN05518672_10782 [Chitinophaga sp. CF118]|uniref:DUF6266 family protein n=1 Tax=Chitinophaga sp. CF118 TaxID=1884367 RepID=UPI0008EE808C|nr:DUF6266 family protein [Chitinophaga sp. CF118]SFE52196.1 hypothetical protein SAMN05518672_10782 [Chitinophaga sp. CF118]
MARLKNGILGGITGVLGPVDGYMLRGQFILRSRRGKSNKPPTEKQLIQQQRIRMINNLLHPITEFVNAGFAHVATGKAQTAYCLASSYQHKFSIAGQYPDFTIDYSKARFTEGSMSTQGINASVISAGNYLKFTWTPDLSYAHSNDHVMLLAYAPLLKEAVYTICGAKRSIGTDVLQLPADWGIGVVIETYLAFKAENSMLCTNSLYLGQIK